MCRIYSTHTSLLKPLSQKTLRHSGSHCNHSNAEGCQFETTLASGQPELKEPVSK